jgi:hypothetical protein
MQIGGEEYRRGAMERLAESSLLLRYEKFGGSIYLAGRAVETALRAVIWLHDPDYAVGRKTLATGHNLLELLRFVRDLGALEDKEIRGKIFGYVERISRLWWNNMRFLSSVSIQRRWYTLGEIRKNRTMKFASNDFYASCFAIIEQCEALWHIKK